MGHPIVINGKFLRAHSTGVHRVAAELANALAELEREGHEAVRGLAFSLWLPKDGRARAEQIRLPRRIVNFLTGIPWEQITLPAVQGRATLLNLCNIGPVLSRNAVTMIHDVQVHLSPGSYSRPFRLWYHLVQPIFARRHRRILTVSAFSRDQIARVGLCPAERIVVVHNGVDHILRVPPERGVVERLGLARHGYVVALSTTQEHKNIGLLLKAFADPALAATPLVLVGAQGRSEFERAGHQVPPKVRFAGRVDDGELRALMEDALCLAFPSTTEGFGLPPLEAMLIGCPAIVAPCGALPEVCGDAALYAPPDDPAPWVEQINALRQSPARRAEFAERGRSHAARFSWREAAVTLANSLRELTLKDSLKRKNVAKSKQ
jgi:glycosyltransferase involved in cell wall biosynthesis